MLRSNRRVRAHHSKQKHINGLGGSRLGCIRSIYLASLNGNSESWQIRFCVLKNYFGRKIDSDTGGYLIRLIDSATD
jgi:hypothetical protein